MKKLKSILFRPAVAVLLASFGFAMSCTKDFDTINTNKSGVATLSDAELGFLFTRAEQVSPNTMYNYQVAQNLFADQYAQYFACEANYFGSDRLVINQGWVGAAFNPMYTDALPQMQVIFQRTDSLSAEYQMTSVLWVYMFHRITDYWGPIPYFHAGEATVSVPYDAQDKIYADFFKRLDAADQILATHAGENAFGTFDIIYGGSVDAWRKFANSLRLRLALRISAVDPVNAKKYGEAAIAAGTMTTSPGDDALVQRSTKGGDGNGLAIMEWDEFRMSASMESVLKGYDDPRISEYYLPSQTTGEYEGLRNGISATLLSSEPLNSVKYNSHHGPRWSPPGTSASVDANGDPDPTGPFPGGFGIGTYLATSQNIMSTAEVDFLKAEAALLSWNTGGTVDVHYLNGITNSFAQWGVGDAAAALAYSQSTAVPVAPQDAYSSPPMTTIPVKLRATHDVALEQVMTQKWIAMFPEGVEAWADYRRSHVVKLYPVITSDNPLITNTATQWLRRIPFLTTEFQVNKDGVATGLPLLGGPDNTQTPLWWDKN